MVIPEDAIEEIQSRWEGGAKQSAYYKVGGESLGYRWWNEEGVLTMEFGLKGDRRHGPYRDWHDNGVLAAESFYVEGKEHGTAKQYDRDGNLIGTYEMHYGTGADLWYGSPGVLSEERYYRNGERHGFERWWSWDNATVWQERHFHAGVEHGIAREWNVARGRLRRGFPQFYVHGERVAKRQYLRASERDTSLPMFREEDNHPARALPVELQARSAVAAQHALPPTVPCETVCGGEGQG
jgi:hypothetical protein